MLKFAVHVFFLCIWVPGYADDVFIVRRGVNLNTPFEEQSFRGGRLVATFPADRTERAEQNLAILQRVASAGFDAIRLNVEPMILVQAESQQLDDLLLEIRRFAESANRLKLRVIVDMHVQWRDWQHMTPEGAAATPLFDRFVFVLRHLGQVFEHADPSWIALEIFNEPQFECSPDKSNIWNEMSLRLFKEIRKQAPHIYLIVSGACWGNISGLVQLNVTDYDARTVFTFHFYEPRVFTYQGETWGDGFERYVPNIPYPPAISDEKNALLNLTSELRLHPRLGGTLEDARLKEGSLALSEYFDRPQAKDFISSQFFIVYRWALAHRIKPSRIILGEFGAMRGHGGDAIVRNVYRDRYLEDVVNSADQFGFGAVIWEYCCVMGITEGGIDTPLDVNVLRSLGLD